MKRRGSPYSVDLRERVLADLVAGATQKEAAAKFKVGVATVYRWSRLVRETGSFAPRRRGGGRSRSLDQAAEQILEGLVKERPDRTLRELSDLLNARGIKTSTASVCRALKRLKLTLKKSRSRRRRGLART